MFNQITRTQKIFIFALISSLFVLAGIRNKPYGLLSIGLIQVDATDEITPSSSSLDRIKKRGYLICGVNGELPGFSFVNSDGNYAGIDVDFCRAIAAALFDDPRKVKFRDVTAQERFSVLKSGEIDLLSRNSTQTLSRDTDGDLEFTPPIFYDAQGIMVNRASKIKNLSDLKNRTICVPENTTSYDNLHDYLERTDIQAKIRALDNREALFRLYEHGSVSGYFRRYFSTCYSQNCISKSPRASDLISNNISRAFSPCAAISGLSMV